MRHRLLLSILLAALALPAAAAAYPWPVKPFDQQHPVRGFFGDPRTIFVAGVSDERDRGARQLHLPPGRRHRGAGRNGDLRGRERTASATCGAATIDLVTPGGATRLPVLPHRRRRRRGAARDGADDRARLRAGRRSVTCTSRRSGTATSSTRSSAATSRRTPTTPARRCRGSSSRTRTACVQTPLGLCGRVRARRRRVRHAADAGSREVPRLPVAPALVTWTITRNSTVVVRKHVAADFLARGSRRTRGSGTSTRAARTRTTPASGSAQYASTPGRYLFLLVAALRHEDAAERRLPDHRPRDRRPRQHGGALDDVLRAQLRQRVARARSRPPRRRRRRSSCRRGRRPRQAKPELGAVGAPVDLLQVLDAVDVRARLRELDALVRREPAVDVLLARVVGGERGAARRGTCRAGAGGTRRRSGR